MAIKRGEFPNPRKSEWDYEIYDSGFEQELMERLESDPAVRKWTKKHGITIGWTDKRQRRHTYRPDFLVEYTDGSTGLIEVKAKKLVDSDEVNRKRQAAEEWCNLGHMKYSIETIA